MSRILVIPHALGHPVRVREVEIASALSRRHDVTLLAESVQQPGWSRVRKALFHADNLRIREVSLGSRFRKVLLPQFAFKGRGAELINRELLNRFISNERFDVVLNAAFGPAFAVRPPRNCRYILDLVDNHITGAMLYEGRGRARQIGRHLKSEVRKADRVTVVSENLKNYCASSWQVDASIIPNGASLSSIRDVDRTRVRNLRTELGLNDRFVFGYIGGMDRFINVEIVNQAFRQIREKHPECALLWIGPGELFEKGRAQSGARRDENIRYLGPVEVGLSAQYLSLFNAGLIPKVVSSFTDAMMPIKSIEYGAARLPVISSPLAELARLGFPNVRLAPLQSNLWAAEMELAMAQSWDPTWDSVFEKYDWDRIGMDFEALFQ